MKAQHSPGDGTGSSLKKRVLIVDDEPGFTRIVKLNLEKAGKFEVREENLAANALTSAREFKPDIILLDVIMPAADGGDIRTSLKNDRELSQVPVLFITATVSQHEAGTRGLSSGGEIFLSKPIQLDTLVHCIDEHLNHDRPL